MQHMTTLEVIDPATEEAFASVDDVGRAGAAAAVEAAAAALPGWAATAPRTRSEVLRRAFELMHERIDDLAETIVRENGKPIAEARGEVVYAAEFFRWFSEEAVRLHGTVVDAPGGGGKQVVLHQPVGVSYLITPWNFPAAMLTRKVGPALAAGCTTIAKPAAQTPLTALALGELLADAGAPEGVVNVLVSRDSRGVTEVVLGDDRVRKLSFTGSTEVGRVLLAQAAERVVNCSMELGGNAPFLVFADADLDAAVEGAMIAKLRHNGETCTAANRFFVEAPVADEFGRRLARAMADLRVGPGIDPDTRLGPLIDEVGLEKVERLVQAGLDGGATVLTGGRRPPELPVGYFYEPTVVSDVPPDSALLAEEVFGPVASLTTFDGGAGGEAEAVRRANDVEHGLVAYVYTGDLGRGMRVAEALEAGMVAVNKGIVSDPAAPFGGVKQSGLGREGGHEGIFAFTETKYVAVDWSA
jgi:succinate-semialdehyde dehydrogenase/glutarate-semialdehyde dehydrogenase